MWQSAFTNNSSEAREEADHAVRTFLTALRSEGQNATSLN